MNPGMTLAIFDLDKSLISETATNIAANWITMKQRYWNSLTSQLQSILNPNYKKIADKYSRDIIGIRPEKAAVNQAFGKVTPFCP